MGHFDWHALEKAQNIIVLNRAFKEVPHADIFITEDERWWDRYGHHPDWQAFKGTKILALLDASYRAKVEAIDPTVTFIRSREKRYGWSTRLEDGLSTSSNSGIPALNLADILGADPIYLLGFDCRINQGRANYHQDQADGYPELWRAREHQMASFKSDFEHWAEPHLRHRNVINVVYPDFPSAIECWWKITFKQFYGRIR